jgi:hypothetical protein
MKTITGVFRSRSDAQRAFDRMRAISLHPDRVTLLTPESSTTEVQSVPTIAGEQPGMGKAIGAVMGASVALSGVPLIAAVMVPGVGAITAMGIMGSAILAAAGASIGAAAGAKLENSMTEGLPEDELFVYEDALRKGGSVVVALADDDAEVEPSCPKISPVTSVGDPQTRSHASRTQGLLKPRRSDRHGGRRAG